MGTPFFAVPMLETLLQSRHQIVGVVTAPDKPAGRGMKMQMSDVKQCALQHGLHMLQPEKLKNESFLKELHDLKADLFVVVAFRMLPEVVWNMPPLGTINLHASLLPQYRGAAPINRAIMNGESETGVTTFKLQHEIDTGKIIFKESVPISADETAGELHDKLMTVGANVLLKTVDAISSGNYPQQEQDHIRDIKHAPKIFKEDCAINWQQPVDAIYNHIRGLSPYPAAHTMLDGKILKVYSAQKQPGTHTYPPGSYRTDGKTNLIFYAIDGWLAITDCQLEGKKRMPVTELLRGLKLTNSVK